jgi:hypothetical protein
MATVIPIGEPVNEAERQAIAYLRDHLPASYLVLHNFEIVRDGETFEVDERDQELLAETVRHLKPRFLLLDPFVRLHRIDENNAGSVSPLLGYLRELQRECGTAIMVTHHSRKNSSKATHAGQGLRGSGDLHAWGDSNLYIRRSKKTLRLAIEHRAAPEPDPLTLALDEAIGGDLQLENHEAAEQKGNIDMELLAGETVEDGASGDFSVPAGTVNTYKWSGLSSNKAGDYVARALSKINEQKTGQFSVK